MQTKTLDFPLEIKSISDEGIIKGYASTFGNVDLGGDVVNEKAFDEWKAATESVVGLWQHDQTQPVGIWRNFETDKKGLSGELKTFPDEDPFARRVCTLVKNGVVRGLSIGYRIPPGGSKQDEKKPHVTHLMKINVREISLVTMPMNEKARVTGYKSMFADGNVPTERELEDRFRDEWGLSNRQAKTFASAIKPYLRRDVEPAEDDPRAAFLNKLLERL